MSIITSGLKRARLAIFVFFALFIAGLYAYVNISKDAYPDITVPIMYAVSTLDGISAEDAEKLIVAPIEDRLSSIEGLKEMKSAAFEGGGFVLLEFDAGYDIDKAHDDTKEGLDLSVNDLPEDANEPILYEISTADFPVISLSLSGEFSVREFSAFADNLKDELLALSGVLEVDIAGDRDEIVEVEIDPIKLESYGISTGSIINSVQKFNVVVAGGSLEKESGKFTVKLPGLIENYIDINEIPVLSNEKGTITLGNLANTKLKFRDIESVSRLNKLSNVTLNIKKTSDANTLDTVYDVRQAVEKYKQNLPDGVIIDFNNDSSVFITDIIGTLQNSIILSLLLVVIVLFGFLGLRSGFLVGIAIPSSFLLGILLLYVFGYRVNMMVLFALVLATGLLVDGSIVVCEFATRRLSDGAGIRQAFKEASSRMSMPIIASTLTTLAAFIPLMFWPGLIGEFMFFLPLTLTLVLFGSLVVALLFIPIIGANFGVVGILLLSGLSSLVAYGSISSLFSIFPATESISKVIALIPSILVFFIALRIFKKIFQKYDPYYNKAFISSEIGDEAKESIILDESKLNKFYLGYLKVLKKTVNNPKKTLLGSFLFLIISWTIYGVLGNGVEFFPYVENDSASIRVFAPGSLSIREKEVLVRKVEDIVFGLEDQDAMKSISTRINSPDSDEPADYIGNIFIQYEDWTDRKPIAYYIDKILEQSKSIAGVRVISHVDQGGPPSGSPISLRVVGKDFETIISEAAKIRVLLDTVDGLKDIEDELPLDGIEWVLNIDRERSGEYGLSLREIGDYVRLATDGFKITSFRPSNSTDEVDIIARFGDDYRNLDQIDALRINSNKGSIPISNIISRQAQPRANTLNRVNSEKSIEIKADIYSGYQTDKLITQIKSEVAKLDLDRSVKVVYGGEDDDLEDAKAFLSKAFLVALTIMFLILLAQFNRFTSAIIILSAIFLSTTGVMWGLLITGEAFGVVMCGIGIIALAGIVVNNNIVLIDTYDVLAARMKHKKDAILLTCIYRLRPVLLTSITTIIGLMPTAMKISLDFLDNRISVGSPRIEIFYQISLTIVSGMTFAAFLTLFVTPAALAYFASRDLKVGRKLEISRKLSRVSR